jgi:hypothetical protein
MIESLIQKLLMMCGLNCVILMRTLLRLSLHVEILITDSTRLFLKNLVNRLMTALLDLSLLSVAYVLMVLLFILIMSMLNSYCMLLIILFGYENNYFREIC